MHIKMILAAALLALVSGSAFSQTTANAGSDSRAAAGAAAGSVSGVTQNYYGGGDGRQSVTYGGGTSDRYTATIRNTPDAYAPNINGGTNPCINGVSGGGSVAGFGLALGGTWSDPNCERRNLSALLHNQGQHALAQEVLCETDTVRQARLRMGTPCLIDVQRAAAANPAPVAVAIPSPPPVARTIPDWCLTASPQERRGRRECN